MTSQSFALARAELIRALTAYSGITTADGNIGGTTLVDANLIGKNDFITGKSILVMSGDSQYEDKAALSFNNANGTITLVAGFSAQVKAGTSYRILNVSSVELDVFNILTRIGTNIDPAGTTTLFAWLAKLFGGIGQGQGLVYYGVVTAVPGANQFTIATLAGLGAGKFSDATAPYWAFVLRDAGGAGAIPQGQTRAITAYTTATGAFTTAAFGAAVAVGDEILILHPRLAEIATILAYVTNIFHEQADVAVNVNATAVGETDVLNLAAANTRYVVRHLRLKCADPGANTVTVRLYELVNDVLTQVDSFNITNANFATYHSLMDMFGLPHLAGDRLQLTVRASAGGPYGVTGQYSFATAT